MVHLKLTRKGIKRLITTMALIAPIIYLFGTMFTYLNGAHGELLINDEHTSYVPKTYEEAMQVDNFSYGDWEWENDNGMHLGFSLGCLDYSLPPQGEWTSFVCGMYGVGVFSENSRAHNFGYGFLGDYGDDYLCFVLDYEIGIDEVSFSGSFDKIYTTFYLVPHDGMGFNDVYAFVYSYDYVDNSQLNGFVNTHSSGEPWYGWEELQYVPDFTDSDSWLVYFDDGANLPDGLEWNEELRSYFVPTLKEHETTSNSNYLFGQMFPHDNFLSKIGADAVSDNPHGFAPFGAMLKFVDDNMLHLADTDIGLMGYGYFYYSAHVLLFVLMFDLTTFFIHFVNKLGDRFAGGMKDD